MLSPPKNSFTLKLASMSFSPKQSLFTFARNWNMQFSPKTSTILLKSKHFFHLSPSFLISIVPTTLISTWMNTEMRFHSQLVHFRKLWQSPKPSRTNWTINNINETVICPSRTSSLPSCTGSRPLQHLLVGNTWDSTKAWSPPIAILVANSQVWKIPGLSPINKWLNRSWPLFMAWLTQHFSLFFPALDICYKYYDLQMP